MDAIPDDAAGVVVINAVRLRLKQEIRQPKYMENCVKEQSLESAVSIH